MDDEGKTHTTEESGKDSTMYYIIGVLVLVLVLGVGYALRPKPAQEQAQQQQAAASTPVPIPTVARGPITEFACDTQYYNTVIGLPQYFLSVEGVGMPPAEAGSEAVTCRFTITQDDDTLARETVEGTVSQAPDLGGYTWKCSSGAIELPANEPVNVDVEAEDGEKHKSTCNAVYLLPPP